MARTQTTGPHRNGNGAPKEESAAAASDGGLVYVSDEQPGLRRMRSVSYTHLTLPTILLV